MDFEGVEVSDYEIKQNKPCYTIDTVRYFKQMYDELYFIIGADNLATLHKWRDIDKLKELVTFIVASRDGIVPSGLCIHIDIPISSSEIRQTLQSKFLPHNIAKEVISYYRMHRDMDKSAIL